MSAEKMTSVEFALGNLVSDRIDHSIIEEEKVNNFLVEISNERDEVFNKLSELLNTDEQHETLCDLESSWGMLELLLLQVAYRQGMKDKDMFAEELKAYGFEVQK